MEATQSSRRTFESKDCEVLLVEDSLDHAFLMETAWHRQPDAPKLVHVNNGGEAKEFLMAEGKYKNRKEAELPRLVISDLNMPICGGLELLKWLRRQPHVGLLPFVIMTSSSAEEDVRNAYSAGVDNYIVKPSRFEQLREIIAYLRCFWSNPSSLLGPSLASAV